MLLLKKRLLFVKGPYRIVLIAAILLLLFTVVSCITTDREAGLRQADTVAPPPDGQGIFDSCVVDDPECIHHLSIFASGGFTLVMNYAQMYASASDQLHYAQEAHAHGIKIIWSMNDVTYRNGMDLRKRFTSLARTCNCVNNTGFITYVVNLVKNLPATYGYYIGDEVDPRESDSPGIHWLANLVKSLDPDHPRLTVGASTNAPTQINYYYPPSMMDTADIIGADYYPYGYITTGTQMNSLVGEVAHNLQAIADRHDKQYYMVLQAFSWERLCKPWPACAPFPSSAQMRMLRDEVLKSSHPRFLLWYSYFELLKSDDPARHWADLVAAAGARSTTVGSPTI